MNSPSKKVILMYDFLSEPGGLERMMINHARYFQKENHEVEILTCHLDKKILNILPFENIKITEISRIHTPFQVINLALCFLGFNKLKAFNPDLFLSYSAPTNFLLRNKKTKKINYINHYPHFLYMPLRDKIEWAATKGFTRSASVLLSLFLGSYLKKLDSKLVKSMDFCFANSNFTKNKLGKLYGINPTINYPPLDPVFKPSKNKIQEKFIFSSGRIIPDKKYEWLIKSMSYMKNKLPLYISGQGEKKYKNKLLNLAKKRNVNLVFLGRLKTDELVKYYSSAEVFAFPTPSEDFGLVPAESIACGTPCVVWGDGAGPTEQIQDGVNGYLAEPYNLRDFASKIDLCIDKKLKEKNQSKIIASSKKFSFEEVKKVFLKEINKII